MPPVRRLCQFGIRTLLLTVLVLSVGLAILAYRARQRRELIAELEALGVTVEVEAPATPQWLRDLIGDDLFGGTYSATITGGVNDPQMAKLKTLPNLNRIVLGYSHSDMFWRWHGDIQKIRRELPKVKEPLVIKGDR